MNKCVFSCGPCRHRFHVIPSQLSTASLTVLEQGHCSGRVFPGEVPFTLGPQRLSFRAFVLSPAAFALEADLLVGTWPLPTNSPQ